MRGGFGDDAAPGEEARERPCPLKVRTASAAERAAGEAAAEGAVRGRGGMGRTALQRLW